MNAADAVYSISAILESPHEVEHNFDSDAKTKQS